MLRMVPRHPRGISSSELLQQLRDKRFNVSLRSVQRDLHSLSCIFPLMSNDTPPYSWSFQTDVPLDLAAFDSTTALTLHLAEGHLKTVLPHSMLAQLEPQFVVADASPQVARLLSDTPLSTEQRLESLPNSDWQRLRACVADDQETLWWVFGLGENIRVLEPESWAMKIRKRAADLGALYA